MAESKYCVADSVAPDLDGPGWRAPACDGVDRARPNEAELGERVKGEDTRLLRRPADSNSGLVLLRVAADFFKLEVAGLGVIHVMGRRFRVTD